MAAIDKTYISDWETFDKIRNWAKDQKIVLKNGKEERLSSFIHYPDITKDEWDEWKKEYEDSHKGYVFECVLWNTPTYVDVWLIRNCPFEEIQERLKEQYGGGWSKQAFTDYNNPDTYEQIKAGTSVYDTYQRNGLGKDAKVSIHTLYGSWIRDKKCWWWITVEGIDWWYNDELDMWYNYLELMPTNTNTCNKKGTLTKKNIVNLIKKWDLPEGTVVNFHCLYERYIMHDFVVVVKKK